MINEFQGGNVWSVNAIDLTQNNIMIYPAQSNGFIEFTLSMSVIVTTGSSRRSRAGVSFLVATVGLTFITLL